MRDEDYDEYEDNPDHDGGIYTAAEAWCTDPAAAKARYGPIASWDTSGVTDMFRLFEGKGDFNEDISRWNVSNVSRMGNMFSGATSFNVDLSSWDVGQVRFMNSMFAGATSFDRQLGGAWVTIRGPWNQSDDTRSMFYRSPGTIVGREIAADGTLVKMTKVSRVGVGSSIH